MAPKKNAPKNAFYFFMIDYRDRMRSQGINIPNGLQGVATEASPEWRAMSRDQKHPFEVMANEAKSRLKAEKYTSQGHVLSHITKQESVQMELQENIMKDIETLVKTLGNTYALDDYSFYFIHMNYYCEVSKKYIPCEFALAEFSLRRGVGRLYHTLVDPKIIPIGFAFNAKSHSDSTHKIPLPPLDDAEESYTKIFHIIKNFLNFENKEVLPPLYTASVYTESVKSFLETLSETAGYSKELVRVYPLHKLFFELRNICHRDEEDIGFPALCLAEEELDRDIYDYTKGISCELHEANEAVKHCSLSFVRRWGFTLAEHCAREYINFIPGQHCPLGVDIQGYKKQQDRWEQASNLEDNQFGTVKTYMHKEMDEMNSFVPNPAFVRHAEAFVPVRHPYTISGSSESLDPQLQSEKIPESISNPVEFKSGPFPDLNISQGRGRVFEQSEFPSLGSSVRPRNVSDMSSVGRGLRNRRNVAERLRDMQPGQRGTVPRNDDSYTDMVQQQALLNLEDEPLSRGIPRGRATSLRSLEERPGVLEALQPMGRGRGILTYPVELTGRGGSFL